VHDWTSLLGPGVIPSINAVLLGYVMYRSGLVPRVIPAIGLIGAPLLLLAGAANIVGINDPDRCGRPSRRSPSSRGKPPWVSGLW
jgi:hypothetical protein